MHKPVVIVLAGPPCSLKSTLAAWLAPVIGGVHIELDALLQAILPHSSYCLEDRLLAYAIMARTARPVLDRGRSPILDCTYSRRICRQQVVESIKADDRLVVMEMSVTPAVAVQRFAERRGHAARDLSAERVETLVRRYPYGASSRTVDSEAPMDCIRAQLLQLIDASAELDRERWVACGVGDSMRPRSHG